MAQAAGESESDGRGDKRSLLRRRRISRPPGLGRLTGVRRIPRSLGGGALGLLVLVIFFAQLSGHPARFLLQVGLLVGVTAFAVWALVKSPIRATFDQRWRPRRRIAALDTAAWADLAARLGARLEMARRPRIRGVLDGVRFNLEFRRLGGAKTIVGALLPQRVGRKLVIYRRRANIHTRLDRETGDDEFDRDWRVVTTDPRLVVEFVGPALRRWIAAVQPERVVLRGRAATAWCPSFVSDPDQLRGLLEVVCEVARVR